MSSRGPIIAAVIAVVLILCVAVWFMWQAQVEPVAVEEPVAETDTSTVTAAPAPAPAHVPLTSAERADVRELLDLLAPDSIVASCELPEAMVGGADVRTVGPVGVGRVPWLHSEGGTLFATVPKGSGRERLLQDGATVGWLAWKDGVCTIELAEFVVVNGVLLDGEQPVADAPVRGCERGAVVRTDVDGRFSFRIARGQRCQPVASRRIDGILWFDLPERLEPVSDEPLDLVWQAPGPDRGRTVSGDSRELAKTQIESLRTVMADQLDTVQQTLDSLPPRSQPMAQRYRELAAEDRSRVIEPLDELLEEGAPEQRFEDFFLLGEAMF